MAWYLVKHRHNYNFTFYSIAQYSQGSRVNLLLMVSQSVGRSVGPSWFRALAETHGHIFTFERMLRCYASWDAFPDRLMGLSCRESQSLSVCFYVYSERVFT